jgi:hypothetical protein
MGGFFTAYNVGGFSPPAGGQPVMHRMQGVPTMPGYRDRVGKWNVLLPPLLLAAELARRIYERLT